MATPDNAIAINGAKYFSIKKDGQWVHDPLEPQNFYSRTFVPDTLEVKQFDTASEMVAEIVDGSDIDIPDLPSQGEQVEEGLLYKWNGIVVRCRQTHNRTIYDPTETLALFTVYRKDEGTMEWIAGEQVDKGTKRTYGGTVYECIQSHVTQEDWTPPAVPALWGVYVEPGGDEWAAGVAYTIGDIVTYDGAEYECRQSHTSQVGWEPPNVLALWLPQ